MKLKRFNWILGILGCMWCPQSWAQDIQNNQDIQTEDEDSTDIADDAALVENARKSDAPDGSSDYEEIHQIHVLEETLLPDDDRPFEGPLLPSNQLELSHDDPIHLLLETLPQNRHSKGLQRQSSKLLASAIAQVKKQLSSPGMSITKPFGIDCANEQAVQDYVAIFTSPGAKTMKTWLKRLSKWQSVLEKALIEEGVPTDLVYLAMIESGFKTRVKSPASAAGMWQFMAPTARDMGLKINEWVDERYDPIKAAHAAANYLKKQYARYNSWPLAMAAYNGGAGTVNVAIDRFNTNDYFRLVEYGAMYAETRRYVPRILAAAVIGHNRSLFGFDGLVGEPPFVFDTVDVPGGTKLVILATAAGCDVDTLKELNPELLKDMTPPGDHYALRIPVDRYHTFVENFDKVSTKYQQANETIKLKFGETIDLLAEDIHVPGRVLRALNGLKGKENAAYGTEIIVPNGSKRASDAINDTALDDLVAEAQKDTINPDNTDEIAEDTKEEKDEKKDNTKEEKEDEKRLVLVSPEQYQFADKTRVFYETQNGDSIKDIADAFHVLPMQLSLWNELDEWAKLRPRMMLQVFVLNDTDLKDIRHFKESDLHIVVRGSEEHKNIIEAQKHANKSSHKSSSSKDKHHASSGSKNSKEHSDPKYIIHVVEKGDQLGKIAVKYGVSLKSILELNNIDDKTPIRKGQKLKIKKK